MRHIGFDIIDGDVVAYRAAAIAEPTWWDVYANGVKLDEFRYNKEAKEYVAKQPEEKQDLFELRPRKVLEPVEHACQIAKTLMLNILDATKPYHYKLYLTSDDKSNFRYGVAKTRPYKGGRQEKPTHLPAVRDYLMNRWHGILVYGEEADDAIAREQYDRAMRIAAGEPFDVHDMTCIVSVDKDLKQIPGLHYDFVKKEWDFVTPEEGLRKLYIQTLMGDSVDNIEGIPQVGEKKAAAMLKNVPVEDLHEKCIEIYVDKFGEELGVDKFEEMHTLVKMRVD